MKDFILGLTWRGGTTGGTEDTEPEGKNH